MEAISCPPFFFFEGVGSGKVRAHSWRTQFAHGVVSCIGTKESRGRWR